MKFPIKFTVSLEEAQILEVSLRDIEHGLHVRRQLLLELGRVLVDKEPGYITLVDEADIWFLRDNIDPAAAFGEVSGLSLITKLYGLMVGYKVKILEKQEGSDADENETENKAEDQPEHRPISEAKSRQTMPKPEGGSGQGDIDAEKPREVQDTS